MDFFPLRRGLTYVTSRILQKCQSDFWSQVVKDIAASPWLPPWSASLERASYHIQGPLGSPSGKCHMVPEASHQSPASACQLCEGAILEADSQPQSSLQVIAVLAKILFTTSKRPWARTTQPSPFQIPDPQKLCEIVSVCCYSRPLGLDSLLHSHRQLIHFPSPILSPIYQTRLFACLHFSQNILLQK